MTLGYYRRKIRRCLINLEASPNSHREYSDGELRAFLAYLDWYENSVGWRSERIDDCIHYKCWEDVVINWFEPCNAYGDEVPKSYDHTLLDWVMTLSNHEMAQHINNLPSQIDIVWTLGDRAKEASI